jgi:hypothetical protein
MNKGLNIVRILLLLLVCFLNVYSYFNMVSWSHLLYLVLLVVVIVLTTKDFIKKNPINNNRAYIIICILSFLIISYILCRFTFDTSLFFNKYTGDPYGSNFVEFKMLYLKQNMIYFNLLLVLLLTYRKINLKISK